MWTQEEAIEFAKYLEPIANQFDMHVALTGGTLYKSAPRKDCDIVLYSHKARDIGSPEGLILAIRRGSFPEFLGLSDRMTGRVYKANYRGKLVDLIFPEEEGEYEEDEFGL